MKRLGPSRRPRFRVIAAIVVGISLVLFLAYDIFKAYYAYPYRPTDYWTLTRSISHAAGRIRWKDLAEESRQIARTEAVVVGLPELLSRERIRSRPVPFLKRSLRMKTSIPALGSTVEFISDAEARRRAQVRYDPRYEFQRYSAYSLETGKHTLTGLHFWLHRHFYQESGDGFGGSVDMWMELHCVPRGNAFHCKVVGGGIT